jgi:hypothetical protein
MFVQSLSKVSLLLPVFRGGDLFLGAIQSIEDSPIPFEKIVISFNGAGSADYEAFLSRKASGNLKKKYLIYRTLKDLSAAEHGRFALNNLLDIFNADSSLMFLAHDDRLLSGAEDEKSLMSFISRVDSNTVYFPSYHCCQAGQYENITHVLERDVSYSVDEFFWLTMRESVSTNLSGMIVPFQAWVDALRFAAENQTGARFEHMLCIGNSVESVNFSSQVKVVIGERPNSDGKLLSDLDHRKAAFAYVMAFYKNRHLSDIKRYPAFLYQLIRKSVAYAVARFQHRFHLH